MKVQGACEGNDRVTGTSSQDLREDSAQQSPPTADMKLSAIVSRGQLWQGAFCMSKTTRRRGRQFPSSQITPKSRASFLAAARLQEQHQSSSSQTTSNGMRDFRRLVQSMVKKGQVDSLKSAFDRKVKENKRQAAIILIEMRKELGDADEFIMTARERLRASLSTESTASQVSFVDFCSACDRLEWRNKDWLAAVVRSAWK